MYAVLINNVLPVFAMLALGYGLGRAGQTGLDEARALNRFAFLILQPALIFMLMSSVDIRAFDWQALGLYALAEVITFVAAVALARILFRCPLAEAWLLGMAVVFVNSLLYVWPIATLIYGAEATLPITAIVAWDAAVSFSFFIISMEVLAGNRGNGGALARLATNPVLLSIVIGTLLGILKVAVPEAVITFAEFAGAGAAPLTLFALGVVLSRQPLAPSATALGMSAIKIAVFPALVWALLMFFTPANAWTDQFVLNAAGPSGAMAFSLALLYKIPTTNIAPVIIWTSVFSLLSLALLA